jgi:hypothetical protein
MHMGFDRVWKKDRTDAEKKNDVLLAGYHYAPRDGELDQIRKHKSEGCHVIGFGPRNDPALAQAVASCDTWIDTTTGGGPTADCLSNMVHCWTLNAEVVAALTRRGKMPTMWKGYCYPDAIAWAGLYMDKKQFHDDLTVPSAQAGELSTRFLRQIRHTLTRMKLTQSAALQAAAKLIADETAAGRQTFVAWSGHLGYAQPNPLAAPWAKIIEVPPGYEPCDKIWREQSPEGVLVLRLGYLGQHPMDAKLFKDKRQRVIHLAGDHVDPTFRVDPTAQACSVDLGIAYGDACVVLEGYPLRILPPSGIAQLAAYGAIAAQVAGH